MTMEEAIQVLESMSDISTQGEAVDMAIKALQFAEHFDLLKEYQSLQKVVRCKDCYHAEDDITHMYCVYFGHKVYEDDYCSNAVERREDGE